MTFLEDLQFVYGDIIELIFCIIYAFMIIRIGMSTSRSLNSAFYKFFMATAQIVEIAGIAAISNVLLNYAMRIIDVRTRLFPERSVLCNIVSFLSHIFALSLSLGKILSVSTRFTAICMPIKERNLWNLRMTNCIVIGMFLIPFALYSFFPFIPAAFAPTPDGYGRYLGISGVGFKVAKAFGATGYLLFCFTTIPMCAASIWRLRKERIKKNVTKSSGLMPKHEILLAVYALVLTATHLLKAILQIIWFVALFLDATQLQTLIVNHYMLPNTLSSFAEPILLFTSPKVRRELITPFCKRRNTNGSIGVSTASNNQQILQRTQTIAA